MTCLCCGHDPSTEPRRPARLSSAERALSARESDKRYYAKVKDERREIFRERRRRYYAANRDTINQKLREQRALTHSTFPATPEIAEKEQAHDQEQAQSAAKDSEAELKVANEKSRSLREM